MCDLNSRYGYYTVIGAPFKKEYDRNGRRRFREYIKVKCDCGTIKEVRFDGLKSGYGVSCGCYNRKISSEQKVATTHGLRYHPIYPIWKSIKQRCLNKKHKQFFNYGGRGITICKEWASDPKCFIEWCINNGWQKGLDIDRENNDGNYEPNNCRFVTSEVNGNNKRNNIKYEFNGELLTLPQIARKNNIGFPTLYRRIHENNLSLAEALSIPLNGKCKKEPNAKRKLSNQDVIEIYNSKEKTTALCIKYDVHKSTIDGIKGGTRYRDYTQKILQEVNK